MPCGVCSQLAGNLAAFRGVSRKASVRAAERGRTEGLWGREDEGKEKGRS